MILSRTPTTVAVFFFKNLQDLICLFKEFLVIFQFFRKNSQTPPVVENALDCLLKRALNFCSTRFCCNFVCQA